MDCLFCKIISGEIPSEKIYEDEFVYGFKDIDPQAPYHVLFVPKVHVTSFHHTDDMTLFGKLQQAIQAYAAKEGFAESGYRVVTNIGKDGGQTVDHLHFHVLAGRNLQWPPG